MFYRTARIIHIMLMIAVLAACRLPSRADGQAIDKFAAKRDYDFAVMLFNQGDYYRAVTEFKRFEFDTGGGETALTPSYAIACCYQHAKQWPEAIKAWRELAKNYPPIATEATYRIAECSIAAGDLTTAQNILQELSNTIPPDNMFASDTKFLAGILLLTQRNWPAAEEQFRNYVAAYPGFSLASSAETLADACQKIRSGKRKSPKTAALFSALIPGLGQAYAGRTGDGLSALVINAIIGLITADQFKRHNTFGIVVGLLTFDTFYGGNIYGAIGAAKSYNRSHEDKTIGKASLSVRDNVTRYLGHPDRLNPYTLDAELQPIP
jgi:tetratricopeptide (TPR) repeat protein